MRGFRKYASSGAGKREIDLAMGSKWRLFKSTVALEMHFMP
jgi:hypothetical protein